MEEAEFRSRMKQTLDRVERALSDVDPDIAECSVQFGAMSVLFADGSKCIISSQPSVRQLWLAVAAKGVAFHFDYDPVRESWIEDKTKKVELFEYLESFFREKTGLGISLAG